MEVEASRLYCNPKIALSIQKAIERKEVSAVASSLRLKNYVIEKLYQESTTGSDASRVRSLELLGKTIGLFSDVVETKEARPSDEIQSELEERLAELLASK